MCLFVKIEIHAFQFYKCVPMNKITKLWDNGSAGNIDCHASLGTCISSLEPTSGRRK